MICEKCIFLSDCNGILLQDHRCNFFLKYSDIDIKIDQDSAETTKDEMNLREERIWSKN